MRKKSKIPGGSDKNYEKDKGEFLQKLKEFLQAKGYVQFDFKVELETHLVKNKLSEVLDKGFLIILCMNVQLDFFSFEEFWHLINSAMP